MRRALALAAALAAAPAAAQDAPPPPPPPSAAGPTSMMIVAECLPRARVARILDTLGMVAAARGLNHGGALAEIYVSADGRYAFVLRKPDGRMCLAAQGQHWHETDEAPGRKT